MPGITIQEYDGLYSKEKIDHLHNQIDEGVCIGYIVYTSFDKEIKYAAGVFKNGASLQSAADDMIIGIAGKHKFSSQAKQDSAGYNFIEYTWI